MENDRTNRREDSIRLAYVYYGTEPGRGATACFTCNLSRLVDTLRVGMRIWAFAQRTKKSVPNLDDRNVRHAGWSAICKAAA
jgi:hypothetical protein